MRSVPSGPIGKAVTPRKRTTTTRGSWYNGGGAYDRDSAGSLKCAEGTSHVGSLEREWAERSTDRQYDARAAADAPGVRATRGDAVTERVARRHHRSLAVVH